MEGNNPHQSFWQFSDQLRLQSSNFSTLSINDSIWSFNSTKNPKDRRNFDISDNRNLVNKSNNNNTNFNDGWKLGLGQNNLGIDLNGGFNKGVSSQQGNISNPYLGNYNLGLKKNLGLKGEDEHVGKKNKEVKKEKKNNKDNINGGESKSGVDKRFKTLPPAESLPRNETVGGYIFVCNNDTMEENLKRQLFGLPPRYRDSVRQITPGLPLFLYNYSTHQLHGIYEAASFGGTNIDPNAWEDKKNPGESRFPAQVRVQTRKLCEPLDEDAFRPILHHYDGPKFRLELSVPEALSLLDIFVETDA